MATALKLIGLKVPSLLLYLGRNFPRVVVKFVVFSKTSPSHPRTLQSMSHVQRISDATTTHATNIFNTAYQSVDRAMDPNSTIDYDDICREIHRGMDPAPDPGPPIDYAAEHRAQNLKESGVKFRRSLAALSAPYQPGRNWFKVREGALSFPPARGKKGTKGSRSMMDMCLRVLADNIASLSGHSITQLELPDQLCWALWKELAPRHVQNPSHPVTWSSSARGILVSISHHH
jgi:hypothetical protein